MKKLILSLFLFLFIFTSYSADRWTTLKIGEGYSPKNDIYSICFDKQGNLWAGTNYGVYKKEAGKWTAKGTENIYVQTFYIDNSDTKWAGLYGGGVFKSVGGDKWENVKDASPTNSVNVISADNKGNIWVGDWGGGAVNLDGKGEIDVNTKTGGAANYDGQHWISYKADKVKLGDNSVTSIACDTKNNMWFGTYHGVSKLENGIWTLFNIENSKLPDNDVYSLASDSKGNIWIGTCNGLAKLSGETWTIYKKENCGLVDNLILSLAEDSFGNIWVGTYKGVSVFDGSKWKTYTTKNSKLVHDRVQTIKAWNKKVYIGTTKGISVFEK